MVKRILGIAVRGIFSAPVKRAGTRLWYGMITRLFTQVNGGPEWTFLNYGYFPALDESAPVLNPEDEKNRSFIQLYHQAVSFIDLKGRSVLEVGCGRGGGSSYVARYCGPVSMVGVDLAASAAAFCRRTHTTANLQFQQGDAEALPFPDAVFDVVVNVESSHCYGSMRRFLMEVKRVLKPGGYLLWADFRPKGRLPVLHQEFAACGWETIREKVITANVVRALDEEDERKRKLIEGKIPRFLQNLFGYFAGLQGSQVYEAFARGDLTYLSCCLRKPVDSGLV